MAQWECIPWFGPEERELRVVEILLMKLAAQVVAEPVITRRDNPAPSGLEHPLQIAQAVQGEPEALMQPHILGVQAQAQLIPEVLRRA